MKKLIILAAALVSIASVSYGQVTIKMANANGCTAVPVTTTGSATIYANVIKGAYAVTGVFSVKSNTASYAASGNCGAGTVGSAAGNGVIVVSQDGVNWIQYKSLFATTLSSTSAYGTGNYYLAKYYGIPDTLYKGVPTQLTPAIASDSSATAGSYTYQTYTFPTGWPYVGVKFTGISGTGVTISGYVTYK